MPLSICCAFQFPSDTHTFYGDRSPKTRKSKYKMIQKLKQRYNSQNLMETGELLNLIESPVKIVM